MRACRETPPTEPPESAVFMEIRELPPNADRERDPETLFSGWMFASSPAVSALEHAVYDVWVVDCEEPTDPDLSRQGVLETITPHPNRTELRRRALPLAAVDRPFVESGWRQSA